MEKDNKLIVNNSIILYVRLIIVNIIGLVVTRVILNNLGATDFGIFAVVGGVVSLIGFINTVMLSVSNRFIAFEIGKGDNQSINKIFNISFNIHLFIAITVFIIGLPLGEWYIHNYLNIPPERILDAIWVLRFALLGSVISFVGIPYNGLQVAKEKFLLVSIVEVITSISKLVIAFLIGFVTTKRLITYAALMAFVTALPTIIYIIYTRKNDLELVKYQLNKQWRDYKEMFSFSIWIGYGAMASIGKAQGANLIINYFFGAMLNAALGIASSINGIVLTFANSVGRAITPQITKSYAAGETRRTEDLVIAASKYTFLLLLIPALPLFLEIDYILNLWLVEVPEYTSIFIRLMLIDALIGALNAGVAQAIFASGRIKWYQIIINTVFLFSLPIAFFVLKSGAEPQGLLYTYIGVSIFALIIRQVLLYYIVHFNTKRLLLMSYLPSFFVMLSLIILLLLPFDYIHSFWIMVISVVYLLSSIFILGLNKKERTYVLNTVNLVILKFSRKHGS